MTDISFQKKDYKNFFQIVRFAQVVCVCVIELMLEKTEEEIKNRISRDTGNIEYKTQNKDKNKTENRKQKNE